MSEQQPNSNAELGEFVSMMMHSSHETGFVDGWNAAIKSVQWSEQVLELQPNAPANVIAARIEQFRQETYLASFDDLVTTYQDFVNNRGKEGESSAEAGSDVDSGAVDQG